MNGRLLEIALFIWLALVNETTFVTSGLRIKLHSCILLKWGLLEKEGIGSSFRVDPFPEGSKNNFDIIVSLEGVWLPLKMSVRIL